MCLSNPLPHIHDVFLSVAESLKLSRIVLSNTPTASLTAKAPTLAHKLHSPNAQQWLKSMQKETEDLFILQLWASFERFLRQYLQQKGRVLQQQLPVELGEALYDFFAKEVEFWKPEAMLDILKASLFQDSEDNRKLLGYAKQVLKYRDWIAHGRNPDKLPPAVINIEMAYQHLNSIVELILTRNSTHAD